MDCFDKLFGNKLFLCLFFSLVSFIFLLPIFQNFNNWGVQDWDLDLFHNAVPRQTILKYHQFPFWNPYYLGGVPLLEYPQSKFLSPFYLFVIIFDVVKGLKIEILAHLILGLFGVYKLALFFKLNKLQSLLSSFVYMLSSLYSLPLTVGMTVFMTMAYIPWIFLFYLKSFENFNFVSLTSFCLVLIFFRGSIQLLAVVLTFLAVYSVFLVLFKEQPLIKAFKIIAITIIFMLGLGAVKFFPVARLMSQFPRHIKDYSGYSLQSLTFSLFNRDQTITSMSGKLVRDKTGFINGISYAMDENGMYIGLIPFFLFCVGIVKNYKKKPALALSFLVFFWLGFGNRIPVKFLKLWSLLQRLPFFNSMRVAQRFRFVYMLVLAIFSGFGLQTLDQVLKKKLRNKKLAEIISFSLVFFILFDLVFINAKPLKDAFVISPPKIEKNQEFSQITKLPYLTKQGWDATDSNRNFRTWSSMYPAFLANQGTLEAYEPMALPSFAIPKESSYYKREVFLKKSGGEVSFSFWSPNKLKVKINTRENDYLVINQNYYPEWKIRNNKGLKVVSINGLLAVKISPEIKELELYYLPASFIAGLIISLLTIGFISYPYLKKI